MESSIPCIVAELNVYLTTSMSMLSMSMLSLMALTYS
jgi:hypothetical protein